MITQIDRVEELRISRESYSVAYMTFIKSFAASPSHVVCFFEGKDVKYYGPRLKMLNPELAWQPVNCGGKEAVVKVYSLIVLHHVYSTASTAFFVDADYGLTALPTDKKRFYCTPCYSVENFYVSSEVMESVLGSEFGFSKYPDEHGSFALCLATFSARLSDFLDGAALLNAWVYLQRRHEIEQGKGRKLSLKTLNLNQLFSVKPDNITQSYTTFDLETMTGCSYSVQNEELQAAIEAVPTEERRHRIRGKFLSFFMRTFISEIAEEAGRGKTVRFPEKMKVPFRPTEKNFLSDLSQYAETPVCLRDFINALS